MSVTMTGQIVLSRSISARLFSSFEAKITSGFSFLILSNDGFFVPPIFAGFGNLTFGCSQNLVTPTTYLSKPK